MKWPPAQSLRLVLRIRMPQVLRVSLLLSILLPLAVLQSPARAAENAQTDGERLVLAFYYTWFDENTWNEDRVPDLPLQPYVSRDRATMGRHIEEAQRAGIDAFLVAWYGPGEGNQTETNLTALLDEAATRNFRIGILYESDSPFIHGTEGAVGALSHAMNVHVTHPAYLHSAGRPVFFFWRTSLYSVATWLAIRDRVDPGRHALWIADGVDMSYQALFEGHFLYSNTWNPPSDLDWTNQKFARWVAEAERTHGADRKWIATVMPGYDDRRTGRSNGFARDREGGAYYEHAWQSAMASNPDWIVITSFNEWPEGTYIEPSRDYGHRYLELTAHWSNQYRNQASTAAQPRIENVEAESVSAAAIVPAEEIVQSEVQQVVPVPDPVPDPVPVAVTVPTAYVDVPLLNLRQGPGTDYPVLRVLGEGEALTIVGQSSDHADWWQVSDGTLTGWTSAEYTREAGPIEIIADVVPPEPELWSITLSVGAALLIPTVPE